ncbi:MAG: hypothetical protein LKK13_02035 [Bacilli bacterium]|nr:hypothetical protein [Bacilli bacterium]
MKKIGLFVLVGLSAMILSSCLFYPTASSKPSMSASLASSSFFSSSSSGPVALSYASSPSLYDYEDVSVSSGPSGLPSQGDEEVLVLPIAIKGYESNATATAKADIGKAVFGAAGDTGWQSVASYYATSSYGKLRLAGEVADFYECGLTAEEIVAANDAYESKVASIIAEAVDAYKKDNDDAARFDTNGDGYLDAVMAIFSCPNDGDSVWNGTAVARSSDPNSTFWAFTYDAYRSNGSPLKEASLSSPSLSRYFWASYDCMYDGYGPNKVDSHIYIHETGHLMGLDDYYDYGSSGKFSSPMGSVDMMDANVIDHDAFSKFALGWVEPYVVSGNAGSVEIELSPSATSGGPNCVLLPTAEGWNGSAFDEYMLLEYYTPTGLNESDSGIAGYRGNGVRGFSESGVRIYHVDARLLTKVYRGGAWRVGSLTDKIVAGDNLATIVGTSNTRSSSYIDSSFKLISEIDHGGRSFINEVTARRDLPRANNSTLFQEGDMFDFPSFRSQFPKETMDDGSSFIYRVAVSDCTDSGVRLTVSVA